MKRLRNVNVLADGVHFDELHQASEVADSTAAKIDEALHRAPAGAIHEQMVADMAFAEGVRDALAWATGLNAATDRLTKLLDLETSARHAAGVSSFGARR